MTAALVALVAGLSPPLAAAQEASSSLHVAVFVDASADVDAFTKMYLYEVLAGRLRRRGFAVTAADPGALTRPAVDCVAEPDCRLTLQRELRAPWLIAVQLEPSEPGRLRVALRSSHGIEPLALEDEEAAIATALDQAVAAVAPGSVPCLVELDSAVAGATLEVGDDRPPLPALLDPGEHEARLEAPGREPWRGPLVCEGGRVLRLHAR